MKTSIILTKTLLYTTFAPAVVITEAHHFSRFRYKKDNYLYVLCDELGGDGQWGDP